MRKKNSTTLILLGLIPLIASCTSTTADKPHIELEEDFKNGQTFELSDKEIDFPLATYVSSTGTPLSYDISYSVTSSNGETTTSKFPSFNLGIGDYVLTYSYQDVSLSYDFKVRDTTGPNIIFSNVPASLFYEENMDPQPLPRYEIDDFSWGEEGGLDLTRKLYFTPGESTEKQEVSINKMNDTYTVTGFGTFEYVISATDRANNTSTNSVTWLSKDYSWVDDSLEDGTLADFNKPGYINYVKTGDVSPYYSIGNDFTAEMLNDYKGANGVLHLDMGFSTAAGAMGCFNSISLKFAKSYNYNDLNGKYLAVRALVDGEGLSNEFGFAGNYKKSRDDSIYRCQTSTVSGLDIGNWKTYYIAQDIAKYCEMTADGSNSNTTPIETLQLYFKAQSAKHRLNLYIDSISIAEKLDNTEIHVGDNLSWNSVKNVDHYEVNLNGQVVKTNDTSIALPTGKGYVNVIPKGDGVRTLDGDVAKTIYGLPLNKDVVAAFDDPLYSQLLNTELDFSDANENEHYRPRSYSSRVDDSGLRLDLSQSTWGIVTGIRFQFPKVIKASDYDSLILTMKIEETNYDLLRIYDYSDHNCYLTSDFTTSDQGKFINYKLPLNKLNPSKTIEGLTLIFGKGGGPSSTKVVATLQSIVGFKDSIVGVSNQDDPKTIGLEMKEGTYSENIASFNLATNNYESSNNNSITSLSVDNNLLKINLANEPINGETLTINKETALGTSSNNYKIFEDLEFVYLGSTWNIVKGEKKLMPCYAQSSLAQFNYFYDFNCTEDDEPLSFDGEVYCAESKINNVIVVGYPNTEKICFKGLNITKDNTKPLQINKGSYVYHKGIAIRVSDDFKGCLNEKGDNLISIN